jgi:hypothetical protein
MARQTFYVTRETRHPLYKTRMLTAGQQLDLDASAARLYRQLGVEMTDEKPRAARKAPEPAPEPVAATEPPRKAPAKRKARTARKAKA